MKGFDMGLARQATEYADDNCHWAITSEIARSSRYEACDKIRHPAYDVTAFLTLAMDQASRS